jgi:hypothetical protein
MKIVLKPDVYQIKNGFAAYSQEIGLTAHGHSPEVAKLNLERTAVMFLRPFEREGKLSDMVKRLRLKIDKETTTELTVVVGE